MKIWEHDKHMFICIGCEVKCVPGEILVDFGGGMIWHPDCLNVGGYTPSWCRAYLAEREKIMERGRVDD